MVFNSLDEFVNSHRRGALAFSTAFSCALAVIPVYLIRDFLHTTCVRKSFLSSWGSLLARTVITVKYADDWDVAFNKTWAAAKGLLVGTTAATIWAYLIVFVLWFFGSQGGACGDIWVWSASEKKEVVVRCPENYTWMGYSRLRTVSNSTDPTIHKFWLDGFSSLHGVFFTLWTWFGLIYFAEKVLWSRGSKMLASYAKVNVSDFQIWALANHVVYMMAIMRTGGGGFRAENILCQPPIIYLAMATAGSVFALLAVQVAHNPWARYCLPVIVGCWIYLTHWAEWQFYVALLLCCALALSVILVTTRLESKLGCADIYHSHLQAYTFNGKMGIACDEGGVVQNVFESGQAQKKDMKSGCKILKVVVGTTSYSKEKLNAVEQGESPYTVTVRLSELETPEPTTRLLCRAMPLYHVIYCARALQAYRFNGEMGIACDEAGVVEKVIDTKPAQKKGIKKGDRIVSVDGSRVPGWMAQKILRETEYRGSNYIVEVREVDDLTLEGFISILIIFACSWSGCFHPMITWYDSNMVNNVALLIGLPSIKGGSCVRGQWRWMGTTIGPMMGTLILATLYKQVWLLVIACFTWEFVNLFLYYHTSFPAEKDDSDPGRPHWTVRLKKSILNAALKKDGSAVIPFSLIVAFSPAKMLPPNGLEEWDGEMQSSQGVAWAFATPYQRAAGTFIAVLLMSCVEVAVDVFMRPVDEADTVEFTKDWKERFQRVGLKLSPDGEKQLLCYDKEGKSTLRVRQSKECRPPRFELAEEELTDDIRDKFPLYLKAAPEPANSSSASSGHSTAAAGSSQP